jgi:hypothetical protein
VEVSPTLSTIKQSRFVMAWGEFMRLRGRIKFIHGGAT